jgi:hypothetical protein
LLRIVRSVPEPVADGENVVAPGGLLAAKRWIDVHVFGCLLNREGSESPISPYSARSCEIAVPAQFRFGAS